MASKPVEVADPRQYLRLAVLRLLETQKCLRPVLNLPQMAAVRQQWQENEYILSEIRSWLEAQDSTSPTGPSVFAVAPAETSGPELSTLPTQTGGLPTPNPFAWRTYSSAVPVGTSQALSSLPSGCTLPGSAEIIRGQIVFRPPSSSERQNSTSDGPLKGQEKG